MFPPDSGANEAERKDVEKVLKDDGNGVIDMSTVMKQQSNKITQPTFEVEYLQAMQTIMQLQPMVREQEKEQD